MKKLLRLLVLCLFVITAAAPLGAWADYSLPVYIRIGLMYGNSAPKSITLFSEYGFNLGKYNGRDFDAKIETTQKTVIVTTDGTNGVKISDSTGNVLYSDSTSAGARPRSSGKDQVTRVDGVDYRGAIDCINSGGSLTVVNVVFLDHYLYGVVSKEMSPSWHIEALKAQAVCARNYTAKNLEKHASQGFDLCSSVHCQAYSGMNVESDSSFAPVDETTRQVLTYDGELAQLYYCASMGATSEDVENVWGNIVPYLISVDNSFEDTRNIPNGIWSGTLTRDEASAIMRNKGFDVGDVTNITALEYTPNGRVLKLQVTGTNGSKIFEREACRTIFNTVTKSQAFTVTGDGDGAKIVPEIQATDGSSTAKQGIKELVMLTANGRFNLQSDTLFATNGVYQQQYSVSSAAAKNNTQFYFEGTGWGHSVGMSQYGAKGMAEAGYKYSDILQHYFPGTNLENAY